MKKLVATLALAGLALAGCGSPIADSTPIDLGVPAHVLAENTPTGHGSLSPFLEDYAPEVFEPGVLESFLDHYIPEEGK